jgi:hypothetical protein
VELSNTKQNSPKSTQSDRRNASWRHSVLHYSAFNQDQPVGNLCFLLSQNTPITGFESVIQEREIPETRLYSPNTSFAIPVSGNVRTDVLVGIYCRLHLFVLLYIICWTRVAETSVEIRKVGCEVQWWQNKLGTKKLGYTHGACEQYNHHTEANVQNLYMTHSENSNSMKFVWCY